MQFQSLITEIEFVKKCRPITFISNRPDNPYLIRPIDFLSPNTNISIPEQ